MPNRMFAILAFVVVVVPVESAFGGLVNTVMYGNSLLSDWGSNAFKIDNNSPSGGMQYDQQLVRAGQTAHLLHGGSIDKSKQRTHSIVVQPETGVSVSNNGGIPSESEPPVELFMDGSMAATTFWDSKESLPVPGSSFNRLPVEYSGFLKLAGHVAAGDSIDVRLILAGHLFNYRQDYSYMGPTDVEIVLGPVTLFSGDILVNPASVVPRQFDASISYSFRIRRNMHNTESTFIKFVDPGIDIVHVPEPSQLTLLAGVTFAFCLRAGRCNSRG